MRYLLLLMMATGCSSLSYSTGDCIEYYTQYKIGREVAIKPNGDSLYEKTLLADSVRKIKCPKEKK